MASFNHMYWKLQISFILDISLVRVSFRFAWFLWPSLQKMLKSVQRAPQRFALPCESNISLSWNSRKGEGASGFCVTLGFSSFCNEYEFPDPCTSGKIIYDMSYIYYTENIGAGFNTIYVLSVHFHFPKDKNNYKTYI